MINYLYFLYNRYIKILKDLFSDNLILAIWPGNIDIVILL